MKESKELSIENRYKMERSLFSKIKIIFTNNDFAGHYFKTVTNKTYRFINNYIVLTIAI